MAYFLFLFCRFSFFLGGWGVGGGEGRLGAGGEWGVGGRGEGDMETRMLCVSGVCVLCVVCVCVCVRACVTGPLSYLMKVLNKPVYILSTFL
jgi:hypothetical protein